MPYRLPSLFPGILVRPIIGLLLVPLLTPSSAWARQQPAPAAAASSEERLEAMEQQLDELRRAIAALKEQRDPAPQQDDSEMAGKPAPDTAEPTDRFAELERRLDILAGEIENLRLGEAVVIADQSEHGFGPAASKVYRAEPGLSFGGYGEMLFQGFDSTRDDGSASGKKDEFDFLRAILYAGYKFNDRWVFNSEIEFEHASTSERGSASVEFAYLDYLWKPELNLRAGLLLVPMGFINELHEPTTFLGSSRPSVERQIIPTTWRENGAGAFGDIGGFSYRTYLLNGLDASGFSSSGLRGGRQKGSKASADDLAWVGRIDYTGQPGLLAGVSAYLGDSGQGVAGSDGRTLGVQTTILEGHVEWRFKGFELRGLYAQAEVDDAARLNDVLGLSGSSSIGDELEGYYLQAGYDLLARTGSELSLIPFVRYETLDTQSSVPVGFLRNPARDVETLTLGLSFKPIDRIVFKLDYQDVDNGAETGIDQFNVGLGYIF